MKININKKEQFIIEMPEEISLVELSSITDRLVRLIKVFGSGQLSDALSQDNINIKKSNLRGLIGPEGKILRDMSKEQIIDALKIAYSLETSKEKDRLLHEKYNISRKYIINRANGLLKKYIIPKEDILPK